MENMKKIMSHDVTCDVTHDVTRDVIQWWGGGLSLLHLHNTGTQSETICTFQAGAHQGSSETASSRLTSGRNMSGLVLKQAPPQQTPVSTFWETLPDETTPHGAEMNVV